MKKTTLILFALAWLLPLRADECLENTDFSDGLGHWYGDGQLASDFAQSTKDPLDTTTSTAVTGVVLQLRPDRWSKLTQEFTTDTLKVVLMVNYTLSSDCTFTDKPDSYKDIFPSLGLFGYRPRNVAPGSWAVILSDMATGWCYYFVHPPEKNSGGPKTFQADYTHAADNMKPALHKTITVGFPPGQGHVTITLVSLKS